MTMHSNSEKPFDCVEFKRKSQAQIYEKIKDMTRAEEIEFFRKEAENGPFADLVRKISSLANDDLPASRDHKSASGTRS